MIWNNSLIFCERILNDLNLKYVLASIGVAIAIIAVFAITSYSSSETVSISKESENVSSLEDLEVSVPEGIMITNGQKHIVPLDKIKSGGPPKDGIPSIDNPKFVPVSESQFVPDTTFVIGLDINGEKRAYPLFIMVWHEIVNDSVGGVPVAVTYCPLCFTNQVFERVIDGKEVEFGTSGKLYNSNLVMYDRLTDSYWSQALGVAITGELTGYELKRIPFDVISILG